MQTNEKRKNNILKVICLLITLIALAFLVKYAWAKYMSMLGSKGNADIARWVFKVNGTDTQVANVANFAITRTDTDNDSVAPNMLAPGTKGEFEIEIDARGTETMLQYLIDITLIKKPENLKFYLKNGNTDEKIFLDTEDNHLKTKGFISLNDTKVRKEIVYWIWELETGNNANEIRINDELDSNWIGQTMEMQISVTGMQSLGPGDVAMLDGTMAKYDFSEVSWYNINSSTVSGVNTNGFKEVPHNIGYGDNYLEFNGSSSWVNLGEINSDYMTLEVTFSADYITTTTSTEVMGNMNAGGGGIFVSAFGDIRGQLYINDGYETLASGVNPQIGTTYCVTLTYDGKTLILYVNGEEKKRRNISQTSPGSPIAVPTENTVMALGCNPKGSTSNDGHFLNGKIYSAAIYNRGLTASEVAQNAQIALDKANNN